MDLENIKFTPVQNGVGAMYARITGNPIVGEIMAAAGASSEPKDLDEHFSELGIDLDCSGAMKYTFLYDINSRPKVYYGYSTQGDTRDNEETGKFKMEYVAKTMLTDDNVREVETAYGYESGDLDEYIGWWIYEYEAGNMVFEEENIDIYIYDTYVGGIGWKDECQNAEQ